MAETSESVPIQSDEGKSDALESGWDSLAHLRQEIDRVFDDFHTGWPFSSGRGRGLTGALGSLPGALGMRMPAVDMVDKNKEIEVRAELPGMEEKDIEVKVTDSMLTISGEKKEEHKEEKKETNYFVSERRYGSFHRSFPLPDGIDHDHIAAAFSKGVLTVTLPKTPEAQQKSKTIQVKGKD